MKKIIACMCGVGIIIPAAASSNPSFDETLKYIKEKVDYKNTNGMISYFEKVEKCVIKYNIKTKTNYLNYKDEYILRLNDISPSHIDVIEWKPRNIKYYKVSVGEQGGNKKIKLVSFNYKNNEKTSRTLSNFVIDIENAPEQKNAIRVAKAFKYLVTICGGKEEMF